MTAGGRAKVGRGGGILAPLRVPMFRAVWGANLIGSTGWLVQGVGAAWLMTTLAGTPDMVALVQTATMAPILLFALFAGALADLWDRRWVLLVAQLWVAVAAFGLAGISAAGLLTPTVLLLFTFLIGTGAALNGPAWQAVVRELVPGEQLAAAVTLNAIGFNLARALGPAVGGAVVATFGTEAAFLLNGIAALALVAVLLFWRRQLPKDDLPRERLGSAVATGLRYVGETAALRGVLTRAAVFGIAASAGLALLPLIARDRLGGGPVIYGLLLGAFGVGALLGAFLIHPLRQRRGAEFVITALSAAGGLAFVLIGLLPSWFAAVVPALAVAGTAWLGAFSTFNISVQMRTAYWVQARVLALYQTVVFGGMALGSWAWGELADRTGLETAYLLAGAVMLGSLALHWRMPLTGGRGARPQARRAPGATADDPGRRRGRPGDGPDRVRGRPRQRAGLRRRHGRGRPPAPPQRCRPLAPVPGRGRRCPLDRGLCAGRLGRAPPPAPPHDHGGRGARGPRRRLPPRPRGARPPLHGRPPPRQPVRAGRCGGGRGRGDASGRQDRTTRPDAGLTRDWRNPRRGNGNTRQASVHACRNSSTPTPACLRIARRVPSGRSPGWLGKVV